MTTKRYFEFVEGSSSKFWEIWREGSKVMTRYGKIGAEGQTTVKDEGDEAKATKLHDKLVGEKTKKGYVEKGAGKAPAAAPAAKKAAPAPAKAAPSGRTVPSLSGKTVVVTGTFTGMPRKEIEAILVASGATLGSSVTKKTQLLIVGADAGSKLEKAEELGVEIMEESDFNDLLDGGGEDGGDSDDPDEGEGEGATGNEGFTHTLFERMKAWVELLGKRGDVEFKHPLEIKKAGGTTNYPADAAAFAKSAKTFNFSYHLPAKEHVGGFLYLSLDGSQEDAYMELDGEEVDAEAMYMLDCDAEGTGLAAWYVLREDEAPLIVWDVETMAKFSSLNEYLTEGAKRAFSYSPCWQNRGEEAPLAELSLPKSTPVPALKKALVAQGTSAAMADDLIKWIGPAVRLLLPLPE